VQLRRPATWEPLCSVDVARRETASGASTEEITVEDEK
jgi:hypothetical protein